jgi:hypothetical protein
MNAHPPHTPDPHPQGAQHPGTEPPLIDVVAGEPPVPITVWRTARHTAEPGRVSARLAYRLVAAYSRPGDTVVDLTDGHTLAAACHTGRRRHQPGWFTDALSIGPATTPPPHPGVGTSGEELDTDDETHVWFGDDLTGLDVSSDAPPAGGTTSLSAATSLLVAMWPLDASDAANRIRLAWLLDACSRLLAPDGCLILIAGTGDSPSPPEDYHPITTAAAGVGLGYLQHIVAVDANADTDTFIYYATDEELLGLAVSSRRTWAVGHLRVHADLLVFTPTTLGQPSAARRRAGGERRA